ncbi:MAG: hypothetical protein R3B48_05845 [Kofleriaceae bacterium]
MRPPTKRRPSTIPAPEAPPADAAPRAAGFRPQTRRAFLALVLAGTAGAVVKAPRPATRSTWSGKTRWIGHC